MRVIERLGNRRLAGLVVFALVAALPTVASSGTPAGADGNEAPGAPAAFRSITASGNSHTCALLDNGSVKCWGLNGSGQLGLGDIVDRGDGPGEMGAALPAVGLGAGRTATAITAGNNHTCALLDNGSVKCWGSNFSGELGLGDTTNRGDGPGEMGDLLPAVGLGAGRSATAITAGNNHTCALLDNGSVKCWGSNFDGRLGLGDTANRGDGAGEMGDLLPAVSLGAGRTATAVTAGTFHTCALLDNGSVKCWGQGSFGQLGLGDTASRGDGAGEMGDLLPAVSLGAGRTATAITAGTNHTCALLDNGSVKCWGQGSFGQLGLGDTASRGDGAGEMGDLLPAVSLGAGRSATAVTAGGSHTCALLDNGLVKCWGNNGSGRLGLGDTAHRGDNAGEMGDALPAVSLGTGRTATAVTAGGSHTCASLDNGSVKCWGGNVFGRLGLGDTDSRGDSGGEMGDALPVAIVLKAAAAVVVTADQASVVAGEVIDYHVTVTNTGGIPLTSVSVMAPDVPACSGGVPDLAIGAVHTIDCSYTTTPGDVPQMANQVLVTTAQGVFALSGTRRTRVDAVAPALSVLKSADQAAVTEGEDIDYHVTVTNTGNVALTGVAVTDPNAPDCAGVVPDLAVGADETVDCTYTTTPADAGTYTNVATADSAQTSLVVSNAVDVAVNHFRPDALIKVGNGTLFGNGVYNTTAVGQMRSARVANRGTATFTAQVQNDGNATDSFTLQGLGTTTRYTVTYKDGATNITTQVVAGTFMIADLALGGTRNITIVMKARAGTPVGNALSRTLTVTSQNSGAQDAVKATVRRR